MNRFLILVTLFGMLPAVTPATAAPSADSANIRVDTRGKNLVSLTVTPAAAAGHAAKGPSSANGALGNVLHYIARAFYDDGTDEDVTQQATWSLVGEFPAGSKVTGGRVEISDSLREAIAGSIRIEHTAGNVTAIVFSGIDYIPGPQLNVWAVVDREGGVKVVCSGSVTNADGASTIGEIEWDVDGDQIYGEESERGSEVVIEDAKPQTYLIRARVEVDDKTISRSFYVQVGGGIVPGAPGTVDVNDITDDNLFVWSHAGQALERGTLASGKGGLAVVIHGLRNSAREDWVGGICRAIALNVPNVNIAAWDWEQMSHPHEYRGGSETSQGYAWIPKSISHIPRAVKDYFTDIRYIRPHGHVNGLLLCERLIAEESVGHLSRDTPIHLIGHSAGGFVAGECAVQLKKEGFSNVMVTMLDTPVPYASHLKKGFRAERYISSWFGSRFVSSTQYMGPLMTLQNVAGKGEVETIQAALIQGVDVMGQSSITVLSDKFSGLPYSLKYNPSVGAPDESYRRSEISHPDLPPHEMIAFDGHSFAHEWYRWTIWGIVPNDGFAFSNLRGYRPFPVSAASSQLRTKNSIPLAMELADFTYFGNSHAGTQGGSHIFNELTEAGMWREMTMPHGVDTLTFRYHFQSAGDGDTLSLHWGDGELLLIAPDTRSARDGFVDMEVDVSHLGGQTGTLVFKLSRRGEVNAAATVSDIRITLSDDPDGDGLTNVQELALGSDPHLRDSDGDGLSDDDEVNIHHTNPAQADSDGDTIPDPVELAMGTDPMDRTSVVRPRMAKAADGGLDLRWQGVPGRTYSVVRSEDLNGTFFRYIATGVAGGAAECSVRDTVPGAKAFYWVVQEP